jgi:hypothetical protein
MAESCARPAHKGATEPATEIASCGLDLQIEHYPSPTPLKLKGLLFRAAQLMWIPEMAREITSRWISDVPSKIV